MMLHVVGRLTEAVASVIGPSAEHLLGLGVEQHLLTLADPSTDHALDQLPDGIGVTAVSMSPQFGGAAHWNALRAAYRRLALQHPEITAVHFHGLRPWFMGMAESGAWADQPTLYLSPHGSRLLPLLPLALRMTRTGARTRNASTALPGNGRLIGANIIATSSVEASRLASMGFVAEATHPVIGDPFFELVRDTRRPPVVIGGSYPLTRAGVERFARLSVVLASATPDLQFQWLGPCAGQSREQLEAASVSQEAADDEAAVLARFKRAWVFVATANDPRMPLLLAQAMAAGVPCVALETRSHTDLIEHGRTGLIAADEAGVMAALCALIDDAALREHLGEAARQSARLRFGRHQLAASLNRSFSNSDWLDNLDVAPLEPAVQSRH